MAKLLIFIVILASFAYCSSTASAQSNELQPDALATQLSRWLVDTLSQKFGALAQFFNVKLRLTRFFVSLYTTENLLLLRNLVEYGMKLGNLTLRFLPVTTEDPNYWWIPVISQLLNANFGGQLTDPDSVEAASETTDDDVTDPPVFFNAQETDSNDIRQARSATYEKQNVVENRIMSLDKLIQSRRK